MNNGLHDTNIHLNILFRTFKGLISGALWTVSSKIYKANTGQREIIPVEVSTAYMKTSAATLAMVSV